MRKLITLAALALSLPAAAQSILIENAKIATMGPDGILENASLLIVDGKVQAVGDIASPADADRIIDAEGRWVTPGYFSGWSQLATVEVGLEVATRDNRADEAVDFNAAFDIAYGVNPKAPAVANARIEGLTRAAVHPTPAGHNIFAGYGALIAVDESRNDIVTHQRAFMVAALGETGSAQAGEARSGAMVSLIRAIEEAARYRDTRDKNDWDGAIPRVDAEALVPVTTGEVPLVLMANRASDITQIIKLGQTYQRLDIIVAGAAEGWMVAGDLAQAEIPVIIDPLQNLPGRFEELAATQHNARRLIDAGVLVAFTHPRSSHQPNLVKQGAGNAVANGLAFDDALKALTTNPAQIFGVDDVLGSLTVGKTADLVIWDGDPLELMSNPDHVFVAGIERPMVSRQTKLRDRYSDLSGATPFAYR